MTAFTSFANNKSTGTPVVLPPGYGALTFEPPKVGTYTLPIYGHATDGKVIDREAKSLKLHDLMGDKVVLLSFIYATCNDINGCPLSTGVFHRVKRAMEKSSLKNQLRLITLSFNPEHDTSEVMAKYGASFSNEKTDWRFLTTRSQSELQPILDGYNQAVQIDYDEQGEKTGTISHTLRVYLIDKNKKIRKIYSVGFLHPDLLINDVKTVMAD